MVSSPLGKNPLTSASPLTGTSWEKEALLATAWWRHVASTALGVGLFTVQWVGPPTLAELG